MYFLGFLAVLFSKKSKSKKSKVAIIRIDHLGDYLLWRPCLKPMVAYFKSLNKEVIFIGNNVIKQLFELEMGYLKMTPIWINKSKFNNNLLYRFKHLQTMYRHNFETVINPTLSRSRTFDDALVWACKAKYNIGWAWTGNRYKNHEKLWNRYLYTQTCKLVNKTQFEQLSNIQFMNFVCHSNIVNLNFYLKPMSIQTNVFKKMEILEPFFIIFPGSGNNNRRWNIENFVTVATFIYQTYNYMPIICGTLNSDKNVCELFSNNFKFPMINLCGKTNVLSLIELCSRAKLVVSVDTGAFHIASALQTTLCRYF